MDLDLRNKRILVLGGTRGIGGSISLSFAEEGGVVGACGRNQEGILQMDAKLKSIDPRSFSSRLDSMEKEGLKKWIDSSASQLGGLDHLIWVASAQSFSWEESFSTDLLGCIYSTEAALPYLKKGKSPSIVVIASKAALLKVPSYKAYSSIKAALISYASSLSRELAPSGIRVNTISPGEIYCSGGFWERIKNEDPQLYKRALRSNPLGRFGAPKEVAQAVVFLASKAASFISGANLLVDGGSLEHVQF